LKSFDHIVLRINFGIHMQIYNMDQLYQV